MSVIAVVFLMSHELNECLMSFLDLIFTHTHRFELAGAHCEAVDARSVFSIAWGRGVCFCSGPFVTIYGPC